MYSNQFQVLPLFIITSAILISGFTVVFFLAFLMNFSTILIITFLSTLALYLIFFSLGVVGISKNREAQGLDEK